MIKWTNILFVVALLLSVACARKTSIVQPNQLPKVQLEQLTHVLDSLNHSGPNFFSAKADTRFSDNNQNVSVKTSLKIKKDSLIHGLISYASVPAVTVTLDDKLITLVNRQDKCYLKKGYNFIKQRFNAELSYEDVEAILLGIPPRFYDRPYFLVQDPYAYVVANQKTNEDEGQQLIRYHLTPDLKQLKHVELTDFNEKTSIVVSYLDYFSQGGYVVPKSVLIRVRTPRNNATIALNYDKIEVDTPKEMVLIIPDSYEVCK